MNIVLIGEESAGIQMLWALKRRGHSISAVISTPSKTASSGASLWNAAAKLGFDTWPAKLVKDPSLTDRICSHGVDLILNVHSLYVIHESILEAARIGAFNLHPGPLPRYAGLNPVSWAIYRGEPTHGVTVHKMVPRIDAGPIAYQAKFNIENTDTALMVFSKCIREGIGLMVQLLDDASKDPNRIPLIGQDLTKREYFGPDVPEGGWLSWSSPAARIVNFVRACDYMPFRSPWGHPRTSLGDQAIEIMTACRTYTSCDAEPGTVGDFVQAGSFVASADEWVLIKRLKIGERFLRPAEVLKPNERLVTPRLEQETTYSAESHLGARCLRLLPVTEDFDQSG